MQTDKKVFVTVGTTKFDNLIQDILSDAVLKALATKGFQHMILQIGKTEIKPNCTPRCGFKSIDFFGLKPSLKDYMSSADLIISHAGAGSCLEALELKKPLVVVINDRLMDNHQTELAQQLSNDGFLYYCKCSELLDTIISIETSNLKAFDGDRSEKIARVIDEIMGF